MSASDLRYPVGPYLPPTDCSPQWRASQIDHIAAAPADLRAAVAGLTSAQLDTPYRPDGWTVRQVVHHVPDSHINAFIRLKMTLTEERPTIKPYREEAWAMLEDARSTPIDVSLALLDAVHDRFLRILRTMSSDDFERRYVHPDSGEHSLSYLLGMYAWHGRHHVAHVTSLRERQGF